MEYWEAVRHWWDSVVAAAPRTEHTCTRYTLSNTNTHFLWETDRHKWLRWMVLETLWKYSCFIIFGLCVVLFDDPSSQHRCCTAYANVHTCASMCICVHVYMCNASHWFWLATIGSVMRCHEIRLIWSWADLCQMHPASFSSSAPLSLSLSLQHTLSTHTVLIVKAQLGWYVVFCLSSHLQCICISAWALVKVNTTPSLRPDQYFLSFSVCTHSHSLPICVKEIMVHQPTRLHLFGRI